MLLTKEQKVKEYSEKQYNYEVGTYNFTYWQGEKYKANANLEKTLSESKRLALALYKNMYKLFPKEMNKWIDESPDFQHDWDGEVHRKYLKKAEKILKRSDFITIIKLLDIMYK